MSKILCAIPTYNAEEYVDALLESIYFQNIQVDILIIDSSSTDDTKNILLKHNIVNTINIYKHKFDHGQTRQLFLSNCTDYEFIIYLTQDVVLANNYSFYNLIKNFDDKNVSAVYGRQLPHSNADLFAQHARYFNYGEKNLVQKIDSIKALGLKTVFLSNSFSCYRISHLLEIGGFPSPIIFGEDMYVASKLILNNRFIIYASDSLCYHSHNYSYIEEFKRYFDMGVFHKNEYWILKNFGQSTKHGFLFIFSQLFFLKYSIIYLFPQFLLKLICKYMGYNFGLNYKLIPLFLRRSFSMNRNYWLK